ncbi:MAG: hypothetical protein QGF00_02850, partial [Planctomycetota bacterium]|nr:hypothetical protein [Planctomycetota bacterium]
CIRRMAALAQTCPYCFSLLAMRSRLKIVAILGLAFVFLVILTSVVSHVKGANARTVCNGRMLAIAMGMRTYCSEWDGFTPPDPDDRIQRLGGYIGPRAGLSLAAQGDRGLSKNR